MSTTLARLPAPLARNRQVAAIARRGDAATARATKLRQQLAQHAPGRVVAASASGAFAVGMVVPRVSAAVPMLGPTGTTVALGCLLAGLGAYTDSPDLVAAGAGALSGAAYVAGLNMGNGASPLNGLSIRPANTDTDTAPQASAQE